MLSHIAEINRKPVLEQNSNQHTHKNLAHKNYFM